MQKWIVSVNTIYSQKIISNNTVFNPFTQKSPKISYSKSYGSSMHTSYTRKKRFRLLVKKKSLSSLKASDMFTVLHWMSSEYVYHGICTCLSCLLSIISMLAPVKKNCAYLKAE